MMDIWVPVLTVSELFNSLQVSNSRRLNTSRDTIARPKISINEQDQR